MHFARDNLRVLVSGAASGVGLACAEAFAALGAELILSDHDGAALARAADRLGAHSRFCDCISEASVAIFAAGVAEDFPSLDVLINVAGRAYVRSLGMTRMSRALLPLLRKGMGQRLIVNVAPAAGFPARDGMFPYCGSISGFEQLSAALAEQTRGTSIAVVNVASKLHLAGQGAGWPDLRSCRFVEVDAHSTAEEIVALVSASRPQARP